MKKAQHKQNEHRKHHHPNSRKSATSLADFQQPTAEEAVLLC